MDHFPRKKAEQAVDPFSISAQFDLFLFSTFLFIISDLLYQFLVTMQTAILLKYFSIAFNYSLFWINFRYIGYGNWTGTIILIVYGAGMLVYLILGVALLFIRTKDWRVKLALTWLAFVFINSVPMGIFAGTFFYDGVGIALTRLVKKRLYKFGITVIAILMMVYFRSFWIKRFLKTAYSTAFLMDDNNKKIFLTDCIFLPWLIGMFVLMAFGIPKHAWYWIFSLVGMGILILPLVTGKIPYTLFFIHKSNKKIFGFQYSIVVILAVVGLLWILSLYQIGF